MAEEAEIFHSECPLNFSEPFGLVHEEVICEATNEEFIKGSRFSPDGTCIITASESNYVTFWNLDQELISKHSYYLQQATIASENKCLSLTNAICIGETIYDFSWYPQMSVDNPGSSCIAVSSRDHPIQVFYRFIYFKLFLFASL